MRVKNDMLRLDAPPRRVTMIHQKTSAYFDLESVDYASDGFAWVRHAPHDATPSAPQYP